MIPRSSYPDTPGCSATSASSTSFVVMVALPAHIRHLVLPSLYRHRYIGTGLMVHDVDGSRDASREGPAGSASVDGLHTSWTSRPDPRTREGRDRERADALRNGQPVHRSEEHTSELQSRQYLVCR